MSKLTVPTYWPWPNMQNCPRWPFCPTYGWGLKSQKRLNSKNIAIGLYHQLHAMIIIAKTMHQLKTRTLSIPWGQRSILGHLGVLKKPAAGSMSSRWHSRMSSYTVAVCDCVFLLYDFFLLLLLSTLQSLISPTWLDWFWPDLVTSTGWPSHLCHMTRLGSKVT